MQPQQNVTPERLNKLAWGFAPAIVLWGAIETGILDALDKQPLNAQELAREAKVSLRGATAVADALVGYELASRDAEGRYRLAPDTAAFLVHGKNPFFGPFFSHTCSDLIPTWLHLPDVIRTGEPARGLNKAGDGEAFFEQFVPALFNMNYAAARVLAQHVLADAGDTELSVLDLAAGSGVWGLAFAEIAPRVTVTAVDWPRVLEVTRRTAERLGVADRVRYLAGDVATVDFGSGYGVATLGHILHSEGEERSRALIKKVYSALRPGGTIAIAEFVANDERTGPPQALTFAVNMLVATESGTAYSFAQLNAWLHAAGFENIRTLEAPAPSPLLLANRPR